MVHGLPEEATCKDYFQVRMEGTRSVSRSLRHYRLEAGLANAHPPGKRVKLYMHPANHIVTQL